MARTLPVAAALALVLAAGLVHGRWTRRWAPSSAVDAAAARLQRLPLAFGDWAGRDQELSPEALRIGEIDGYLSRRYENRRDGSAVSVLLVCGRPGPISVHTPDVCYRGAGFEPLAAPARRLLPAGGPGRAVEALYADFGLTTAAVPVYLRIFWSWSSDGSWEAPDNPRLSFASRRVLYKLYLVRETAAPGGRLEGDPSLTFLRALLPELERALFAAP